jgi:hypothetical protein
MGTLEGAWGIHLECHQFHRPFSTSRILLVSVCHMVLSFERSSCLRFLVGLELQPPPAVHGFRHTAHVLWTEFKQSAIALVFSDGRNLRPMMLPCRRPSSLYFCWWAAREQMGVGDVVNADSVALVSLWEAPTAWKRGIQFFKISNISDLLSDVCIF